MSQYKKQHFVKRDSCDVQFMMEPPKYANVRINIQAIMRRNRVRRYTQDSKCQLKRVTKRATKQDRQKSVDHSTYPKNPMEEREQRKSQKLSTVSLYHQADRDVRSVSKGDFDEEGQHPSAISSILQTAAIRQRFMAHDSLERSKRLSSPPMILSLRRKKSRKAFECKVDEERQEQIRKEMLELIDAKEKRDKGMTDDETNEEETNNEYDHEEDGNEVFPADSEDKITRREYDHEEETKNEYDDEVCPADSEYDEVEEISHKGIIKNRTATDGKDVEIKARSSKKTVKTVLTTRSLDRLQGDGHEFTEETAARKNRNAEIRKIKKFNPSTASLYHYIARDLRSESAFTHLELETLLGKMSMLDVNYLPHANSSIGVVSGFSAISNTSYTPGRDNSFIAFNWKMMLNKGPLIVRVESQDQQMEKEKKPSNMSNLTWKMCTVKKAASDMCARVYRDEPCNEDFEKKDYSTQREGPSRRRKHEPPIDKFTVAFDELTKEGGLKTLLCEIMTAARHSRTTNIARFIADFLDCKMDMREIRERSDDQQTRYRNQKVCCSTDDDEATWIIYHALRRRMGRTGERTEDEDDADEEDAYESRSEICANREDVCDPCASVSEHGMLTLFDDRDWTQSRVDRYKQVMMRRDTCSKLGKIVRPPKGEIDLGEKRIDLRDDVALMMHVLTLKGLEVEPICDSEETTKPKISPPGRKCDWWTDVIEQGKTQYEKWNDSSKRDSRIWICRHKVAGERQSLLPKKKQAKGIPKDKMRAIQFVKKLCLRKQEAMEIFDCRMRDEDYKGLALTLFKERRRQLDEPQPPEALVPDQPSDFPEEAYRALLEKEKLLREELLNQKKRFKDILRKIKRDQEPWVPCPRDCTILPSDETVEVSTQASAKEGDEVLISNYKKEARELFEWDGIDIGLTKHIIAIIQKLYPVYDLADNYENFDLNDGVDYLNSLIITEAASNPTLFNFLDTLDEKDYVRILIRICQECPRLPTMQVWRGVVYMFDVNDYTTENEPPVVSEPGEEEWNFASNWADFFKVPTHWSVHGDYGRYRQYFLDLEDPDETSEPGDPMKALPVPKVRDLWQDLPTSSSVIDHKPEYLEPRPLESLIQAWLEGKILKKVGQEAMKTLKIEDIHSFAESNRPLTSELAGLIREKTAEQRLSLLGYIDSDNPSHPSITRIVMSTDVQPITSIQIISAGAPGKSVDKFHQGMEKMLMSIVKTDALKKMDGMEERIEVITTQERNIANSKASTVFNEDEKSGISKSQDIEEQFLPKNSLGFYTSPVEKEESAIARKVFTKKQTSLVSASDIPRLTSTTSKTRPIRSKHSRIVSSIINDQVRLSVVELVERSTPTKERARSRELSTVISSAKLDSVTNVTEGEPDVNMGASGGDSKHDVEEIVTHADDIVKTDAEGVAKDEVVEDVKTDDIQAKDDAVDNVTETVKDEVVDVIETVKDDAVDNVTETVNDEVVDVIETVKDDAVEDAGEDIKNETVVDVIDEGIGEVIGDAGEQKRGTESDGQKVHKSSPPENWTLQPDLPDEPLAL